MISYSKKASLRRIVENDLPKLMEWRNDVRIWKWCRQNDLIHPIGHQAWHEWQARAHDVSMYAVVNENGDVVGVAGLTSIDRINRRAEFSLYIGPNHQGVGYGRVALYALLRHGFENLGLHSVWGETFDGNPAEKMFQALGFQKEGTRRAFYYRNGAFIDAHLYSIQAGELKP